MCTLVYVLLEGVIEPETLKGLNLNRNPKPRVTVAMCVKNAEATVKQAIESTLNQNYSPELVELIVVDGCSGDKTMLIIREALSKSVIKYKFFHENKGLGYARQIAVDNASGDYIVWVDGDTILSCDYVRKQVDFMEQNPVVGIAEGRFALRSDTHLISALENIDWVAGDYQKRQISMADPRRNCCAGSIYRVKAIRQAGGFDPKIKGAGEDMDMGYKIYKTGWSSRYGTDAVLLHKGKDTLISIWNQNFWFGYGAHYILHRHNVGVPVSSISEGVQRLLIAYRLTRLTIVLILPFLYLFKKFAWLAGFTKAHIEGYGHK